MDLIINRKKRIIRDGIIGIFTNLTLFLIKLVAGFISSSISILLDSINNLTDALSSAVTIAGAKISSRSPDKTHPLGHGRAEYISAVLVSVIIIYAGLTALIEAVKKIASPRIPEYSALTFFIITVALFIKSGLGIFLTIEGEKLKSSSLSGSGKDSLFDCIISLSILLSALLCTFTGKNIEAWLALGISIIIIKSGVEILIGATSKILGKRVDSEISIEIKKTIYKIEGILGVYDLILHDYGPECLIGSVHIEIPSDWKAEKIDSVTRLIKAEIFEKHKVILTAIGIYSNETSAGINSFIRKKVLEIAEKEDYVLQVHGFYLEENKHLIHFDAIVDFSAPDREKIRSEIEKNVSAAFPEYSVNVTIDPDISD